MRYNDQITKRLEELMLLHPALHELTAKDATVYAWMKVAMTHNNREYIGSAEEILVGLVVTLAHEKQQLFDQAVKHAGLCMSPKVVPL